MEEELVVEEELAKKRDILDCQQYEWHETRLNSTLLKTHHSRLWRRRGRWCMLRRLYKNNGVYIGEYNKYCTTLHMI